MDGQTLVIRRTQRRTPGLPSPEAEVAGFSPEHGSSEADDNVRARRRPMPRKGHTKSRRGCLNCKRRKVKCQETLPGCINCQRLGLMCEYPNTGSNTSSNTSSSLIPSPSQPLQSTGGQFTMEDLQFFQHFLFHAYPPLPLGGDAIWKEVASFSHHFEFLVHAMLGLAASHLALGSGANYKQQALSHRVSAIESLNKALSRPCGSKAEADALFATVMALAFQSSYMADGMLEFLSMIRGCMVVNSPEITGCAGVLFRQFSAETHTKCVKSLNLHSAVHDQNDEFFDSTSSSLKGLQSLCQSTLEVKFLACLDCILKVSKHSHVDGFLEVSWGYNLVGEATAADFNLFINPENYISQIIMAHFFMVEYVVALAALRTIMHSFPFRKSIVVSWINGLAKKLPVALKNYLSWPMEWASQLGEDLELIESRTGSLVHISNASIKLL